MSDADTQDDPGSIDRGHPDTDPDAPGSSVADPLGSEDDVEPNEPA